MKVGTIADVAENWKDVQVPLVDEENPEIKKVDGQYVETPRPIGTYSYNQLQAMNSGIDSQIQAFTEQMLAQKNANLAMMTAIETHFSN